MNSQLWPLTDDPFACVGGTHSWYSVAYAVKPSMTLEEPGGIDIPSIDTLECLRSDVRQLTRCKLLHNYAYQTQPCKKV